MTTEPDTPPKLIPPSWIQAMVTGVGSIMGAFFVSHLPVHPLGNTEEGLIRDFLLMAAGAVLGGLFVSWASKS